MNRFNRPTFSGWAVILLGMAVLTLGGCGRKGPLDEPPNSSSSAQPSGTSEAERTTNKASVFDPSYGANAEPSAPKGKKRPFVLDPILGE